MGGIDSEPDARANAPPEKTKFLSFVQEKYRHMIKEIFSPLPILSLPLLDREIVGIELLEKIAVDVYGDKESG